MQESIHGLMVFRHAVSEDVVRRVVIAEEFGFLDTQFHLADDHRFVVVFVIVVASRGVIHQELLAQFAVLAVLEYRGERGALGGEEPFARMSCSGSFLCSSGFGRLRQTFELRLVGHEILAVVGLCHYVVTELEGEQTQFHIDLFKALFLVLRQVSPVVRKGFIGLGNQTHLLGVQTEVVTLVIHRFDALEECIVEDDTVA